MTHLTLGENFNHPIRFCHDNLPRCASGLTHLTFGKYSEFNQPIRLCRDNLPSGLTYLSFGSDKFSAFNQPIDNLPQGLNHLKLGGIFNQSFDNLPSGLAHLDLGWKFNQ